MSAQVKEDYIVDINLKTVNKLLQVASNIGCEIEAFEGTLVDNYIIYNTKNIQIEGILPRKYIILREKYLNSWSSITELTMTDNENKVFEFENKFLDAEWKQEKLEELAEVLK